MLWKKASSDSREERRDFRRMEREANALTSPNIQGFKVPERSYFAHADISYFSKDSRDFGPVPELNVTGKGLFVYWPFSQRWGLIH
jgi:hypothetical protein